MKLRDNMGRSRRSEYILALLFIIPGYSLFILFNWGPNIMSLILSFFKWDIFTPMKFIGLDNFIKLFTEDPLIPQITLNSFLYFLYTIPAMVILPLIIAILLSKITIMRGFFQSIYFLPIIASGVSISIMFRYIYSPSNGLINNLLFFIDKNINWLTDTKTVLFAISIIIVWKSVPFYTILYLAHVRNIPSEQYEAAKIDGCRELGLLRYITLPAVKTTVTLISILSVSNSFFNGFEQVKVLTEGRPLNASNIFAYYIFKTGVEDINVGYSSAIAFMFFILFAVIAIPIVRRQYKTV